MFQRKPWTYGTKITKREYLNSAKTFDNLVEEISEAIKAVKPDAVEYRLELGEEDLLLTRLHCSRPSWHLRIEQELLDKFFNGTSGIRAQYYISPYHGRHRNARLLRELEGDLVRLANAKNVEAESNLLEKSLRAGSAKVWICEKDLTGNKLFDQTRTEPDCEEIQNDWLDVAREACRKPNPETYKLFSRSLCGVQAPIPDRLEIKGAWLTEYRQLEYVTPDKRDRDCQLFMFGFS